MENFKKNIKLKNIYPCPYMCNTCISSCEHCIIVVTMRNAIVQILDRLHILAVLRIWIRIFQLVGSSNIKQMTILFV